MTLTKMPSSGDMELVKAASYSQAGPPVEALLFLFLNYFIYLHSSCPPIRFPLREFLIPLFPDLGSKRMFPSSTRPPLSL